MHPYASLWKSLQSNQLMAVFSSLVGTQVGGALLGLVYWTVAARALTPEQLGVGAALVATMTLVSYLGVLGVGTLLLERFKILPASDRRALWSTGLIAAGIGGAVIAGGWLALSSLLHVSGALGNLSLTTVLLLVAATGIASTCLTFDQAVIGMGASSVQLRRNILASVLRIAVFSGAVLLDFRTGQAILVSWMVALLGSVLATRLRRHLPRSDRVTVKQRWNLVRTHWTVAIGHHGLTLATNLSSLMIPVVVAMMMSATQNAYFSQARLLGDTALALPFFLTVGLFATAHDTEGFRRKAPRTLIWGMVLALLIILVAALFGRFLLLLFGGNYSEVSLPLLVLYLTAGPASVVKDHFVVLRRLQARRTQGAVVMGLWTGAELAGAVVGGLMGGVTTLLIGWVTISTACALIALPVVLRAISRKQRNRNIEAASATMSSRGSE
jgi:O-antigen/teichoic acid export membrane protein